MPRANFGGAVDFSALFADLYRRDADEAEQEADELQDATDSDHYDRWQNELITDAEWLAYINTRLAATSGDPKEHQRWVELQRQVETTAKKRGEAKAKEAEAAAKAQKSATDADMQSQWEQGLIGDDEWMDYIRGRVSETTNSEDPKEHQGWVEAERAYSRHIEDRQMTLAFEQGTISSAQFIAYKQRVLGGLDEDSVKAQELRGEITALIDSTFQTDVVGRADEIIQGIQSGTHTLNDLLAFYKDSAKKARSGSELAQELAGKVTEVEGQIRSQARNGALERIEYLFKANKITGAEAGRQIRAIAEKYDKGDEATYYNTLEAALGFEKYPGRYADGTGSSGGGGGGGGGSRRRGGGGGGGGSRSAGGPTIKSLDGNITRIINITDQAVDGYNRGEDSPVVYDPGTGREIVADPKTLHALQLHALDSYDAMEDIYRKAGKMDRAADVSQRRTNFIQKAVQPINTIGPAEQTQRLVSSVNRTILNTAEASNDPQAVIRVAAEGAEKIDAYAKRLTNESATVLTPMDVRGQTVKVTTGTEKAPEKQPLPQLIKELNATSEALRMVATPGSDPKQVQAALDTLNRSTGDRNYIPTSATAEALDTVMNQNAVQTGLQNGTYTLGVYVASSGPNKGQLVVGPIDYTYESVTTPEGGFGVKKVPNLDYDPSNNEKPIQVFMDVNGVPTPVWTVERPLPTPYEAWQAQSHVVLVDAQGREHEFFKGQYIPSNLINRGGPAGDETEAGTSWAQYTGSGAIKRAPVDLGWTGTIMPPHRDKGKNYEPQVWVKDPKTGRWVIGQLPVGATLASDGTVMLAPDQSGSALSPQIVYKAHGMAGSVAVPYVGNNNRTMQAIAEAQGMTAGQMMVDSQGNVVPAPDWYYRGEYYDPDLEAQARSARALGSRSIQAEDDNWWNSSIQQAKLQRTKDVANATLRDDRRARRDQAEQRSSAIDTLTDFASQFGIKMSKPVADRKAEPKMAQSPVPLPNQTTVKQSVPSLDLIALRPAPTIANTAPPTTATGLPVPPAVTPTAKISAPIPLPKMTQAVPKVTPKAPEPPPSKMNQTTPRERHTDPKPKATTPTRPKPSSPAVRERHTDPKPKPKPKPAATRTTQAY